MQCSAGITLLAKPAIESLVYNSAAVAFDQHAKSFVQKLVGKRSIPAATGRGNQDVSMEFYHPVADMAEATSAAIGLGGVGGSEAPWPPNIQPALDKMSMSINNVKDYKISPTVKGGVTRSVRLTDGKGSAYLLKHGLWRVDVRPMSANGKKKKKVSRTAASLPYATDVLAAASLDLPVLNLMLVELRSKTQTRSGKHKRTKKDLSAMVKKTRRQIQHIAMVHDCPSTSESSDESDNSSQEEDKCSPGSARNVEHGLPSSIPDQLERLASLLERGFLNPCEFETAKSKVLHAT
jgi:hypothetical protein